MKSAFIIPLLLGFVGVSLIAEPVRPGDFLYPVKVHVNDNVRTLAQSAGFGTETVATPLQTATLPVAAPTVVAVALDTPTPETTDTVATLAAVRVALEKYQGAEDREASFE